MFFFTNPRSSFTDNYIVTLCLVYCVTGIACVLAIFSEPGPARLVSNGALASICADEFLWSVLLPVVLTLIAAQQNKSELFEVCSHLVLPKWVLEAFAIVNAEKYYGVWLITSVSLLQSGHNLHYRGLSAKAERKTKGYYLIELFPFTMLRTRASPTNPARRSFTVDSEVQETSVSSVSSNSVSSNFRWQ
ncbi:hypothetical protein OIU84_020557 [Salix udensis]|uniref:ABC transporter family G domain-containing protein n=1 Tax=Salix udensis TaxID=889485 RepID=A0AAD6KT03_9ROSI|nr:hypothetical protein OIU84_020557 [Salix udensis]